MKKVKKHIHKKRELKGKKPLSRKELEKKVVEGAKKAVKEYQEVFKRLAEFDRV